MQHMFRPVHEERKYEPKNKRHIISEE